MQSILEEFDPEDRFNADETGCNWQAAPDRGLATKQMAGKKVNKKRISILFTCSETGEKLPPFFIGKAKCPRPFKKTGEALGLYYRNNKKAWMTRIIWEECVNFAVLKFLLNLRAQIYQKARQADASRETIHLAHCGQFRRTQGDQLQTDKHSDRVFRAESHAVRPAL
jgi:hypothetical protein